MHTHTGTHAYTHSTHTGFHLLRPFKLAIFSMQFVDNDNLLDQEQKQKSIQEKTIILCQETITNVTALHGKTLAALLHIKHDVCSKYTLYTGL